MPTENLSGWQRPEVNEKLAEEFARLKSQGVQPMQEDDYTDVQKIKQLRQDGDKLVQRVKDLPSSRELSLSITNFQQAVMWLGMELKRLNEPNPYPSSKDPNTGDKIEPTADGLKF